MRGAMNKTIQYNNDEISPEKLRLVVFASSLGTMFEWYDFFIFGLLTQILADHFFAGINPTASFIFGLLAFGAGFMFRPLGALVFGAIGDKEGRKGAFLITVSLMGLSTFLVSVLPSYSTIGIWAPILLMALRIIQGFALGGEYGGAVIYVAEHSPHDKRGFNTSLVQSSAVAGLLTALLVVYSTRTILGEAAFHEWAWRIPFAVSLFLLAIAIYIRMQLEESPSFKRMQDEDNHAKAPLKEVFGNKKYLGLMLVALFGLMIAQGVTWFTSHFYSQVFLGKQLKIPEATINFMLMIISFVSGFLYVFFGWLSDKIGRKPVMLFGITLALISFYPGFNGFVKFGNPDFATAIKNAPIKVIADQKECSIQFNPIGKTPDGRDAFATSCDVAKSYLAGKGIPYQNINATKGTVAKVIIGDTTINSIDISKLDLKAQKTTKEAFGKEMAAALAKANYPEKADPKKINFYGILGILFVFIIAATALYGPLAASLVELFPMRIRYTALSIPYNIGTGIFGGFVPAIGFAIVATTGNMFSGLYYPMIVAVISIIVTLIFLPETKDRDIHI